jgi:Tol biopolymer transport system component
VNAGTLMATNKRARGGPTAALTVVLTASLLVCARTPSAKSFPGENGLIALVRESAPRALGIYTIDPSDSSLTRLTRAPDYRPRWSPDGSQIVFQRFSEGLRSDIYVMSANGSGVQRLTDLGFAFQPAWSPDGSQIAFGSGLGRSAEIFVMNADGSEQTRLTHDGFRDSVPAWSPDSTTIAFASRRHDNWDLYLMSPDGSHQSRLTHVKGKDANPDWSPDGSQIVFQSNRRNRPGDWDIWAIRPDGSGSERLTRSRATEWAPAWSSDGTQIAFTIANYDRGVVDIAILTLDSPVITRFVISDGTELQPNWQAVR